MYSGWAEINDAQCLLLFLKALTKINKFGIKLNAGGVQQIKS